MTSSPKALPEPRHACRNCAHFYPVRRLRQPNLVRCFKETTYNPVSGKDEPVFEDAAVIRTEHPDTCPRFEAKAPSKASKAFSQVRGFARRVKAKASPTTEE